MRIDDPQPADVSPLNTNDTLNRVLTILERSFPQYLRYARPHVPPGREHVLQTIEEVAAGEDALAERVFQLISDSGGRPDSGDFPIEYTDTHDLSIAFLVREAIDYQKQDIAQLEQCADALRPYPTAESVASEAVGMAKAHLELLQKAASSKLSDTKLGPMPAYANDPPVAREASGTPHRQEERKLLAGDPNSPA